jgi:hypothetical protein
MFGLGLFCSLMPISFRWNFNLEHKDSIIHTQAMPARTIAMRAYFDHTNPTWQIK